MSAFRKPHINRKAQIFLGLLVFGAAFGSLMAASPAFAQSSRDINNRLGRIENELETLGRAVYRGEKPPAGAYAGSGGSAAETEVRIQGFESQIRDMTGKLEEQDNQIRQLREQLDKLTADIELRLQDGGSTGGSFGGGGASGNSGSYTSPVQTNTPSQIDNGPAQTDTDSGYQWKSGSASQLGTYAESDTGRPVASGDSAAGLYESAFSLLKGAQYDEAEKEFLSFLSQYPGHALTGNAIYWLGETYYVRGKFDKAAKTFAEGYRADPKGAKAADNLLKMGMSLSGLGKKSDACVALGQIEKEYSTSAGPVLRRAQQEMTRLGC
jgi:tol-pal system protein YbgF